MRSKTQLFGCILHVPVAVQRPRLWVVEVLRVLGQQRVADLPAGARHPRHLDPAFAARHHPEEGRALLCERGDVGARGARKGARGARLHDCANCWWGSGVDGRCGIPFFVRKVRSADSVRPNSCLVEFLSRPHTATECEIMAFILS